VDVTNLLSKLQQDGPGSPIAELAELSVDALLDTPMSSFVTVADVAAWGRRLSAGLFASTTGDAALTRAVEAVVGQLQKERRPLEAMLPREMRAALREVVRRPFSPDRRVVLSVIDREPFRELVRQILVDAVMEFGKRASAPVAGMARGLGTLARMAQETVKSASGGLGSLVGAVGSEVERQLEKRAVEFVDAALAGVLGQLADAVADPRRAAEASELRLSLFDGALALTGPQLAREVMNGDVPGAVQLLKPAVQGWVASKQADAALETVGKLVLSVAGTRTARQQLEELGVLADARALAIEQTTARLRQVVATPAFAAWLAALVTP
jgi:hypothetical protein